MNPGQLNQEVAGETFLTRWWKWFTEVFQRPTYYPEHDFRGYTIIKKINEGNQGRVLLAQILRAIKEVNVRDEQTSKYAYRELLLLKGNVHPNLVHIFAAYPIYDEERRFVAMCLVMEYIPTQLAEFIANNSKHKLSKEGARKLMHQLLCGLKHLHQRGIIHRDIKPANMGITSHFQLKIMDFGIARPVWQPMTSLVGTESYRAPEVQTQDDYTEKSEVYASGLIGAELLYKGAGNTFDVEGFNKIMRWNPKESEKDDFWTEHFPDDYFIDTSAAKWGRQLFRNILSPYPDNRPHASEALNQPFFDGLSEPYTRKPSTLQYEVVEECDDWNGLLHSEVMKYEAERKHVDIESACE
ncbi:protein kinase domain-containing protein [Ditylenchus destructor]|nr:protein kinase domain-containing protein [Ditylenchus destructor]